MTTQQKNVAIFGVTSAIAEQVARLYAQQGARLFVVARDAARLDAIKQDLQVRGATEVFAHAMDFGQTDQFKSLVTSVRECLGGIDVALIAYGTLPDQAACVRDAALSQRELLTNFASPVCLLTELAQTMSAARHGIIGAITSVAGDRGRSTNYVYGAAKGGLSVFLAGLRHRLADSGVEVLNIKPGFVDSPMTAHINKGGPLWATPQRVAREIHRALENGRGGALYTPRFWWAIMTIIRCLPWFVFRRLKI